jgi:polysaccharide pyruvyl transferase WcaK-like protein
MENYCGRNRMFKKRKDKEKWTARKEVMEKWGKRSERNNGKANKRNKAQEKK